MKSGVKSVKELNLEDDFLFAKVMTDESICKIVLEKILGIEIKEIKMPEEQKVINILSENKGIRLDIYVNDEMSQVGIEDIVLEDGMKISFVMTEYEY